MMRFKIPDALTAKYRDVAEEKGTPWVVVDYSPMFHRSELHYCASYHHTRAEARREYAHLRNQGIAVRILRF